MDIDYMEREMVRLRQELEYAKQLMNDMIESITDDDTVRKLSICLGMIAFTSKV